jgi:hypothetical protein
MDSLITQKLVADIADQLREILTIPDGSVEHVNAITALFDGEETLVQEMEDLVNLTLNNVQQEASNAQARNTTIKNSIITAMLIGFLSERYTRDAIMDKSKNNAIFKREYESAKAYIGRKVKSYGSTLQEIAVNETTQDPKELERKEPPHPGAPGSEW